MLIHCPPYPIILLCIPYSVPISSNLRPHDTSGEHYPRSTKLSTCHPHTKKKISLFCSDIPLPPKRVVRSDVWVLQGQRRAWVFECFARYTETEGLIFPELYPGLADVFVCIFIMERVCLCVYKGPWGRGLRKSIVGHVLNALLDCLILCRFLSCFLPHVRGFGGILYQ